MADNLVELQQLSDMLVSVARERARLLAPAVWASTVFVMAAAGSLGIQPAAAVRTFCWIVMAMTGIVVLYAVRRRIPHAYVHLASSVYLLAPTLCTAAAMYSTKLPVYTLLFVVLIASAGVLLDTRLLAATLAIVLAFAVPIVVHVGGPFMGLRVSALWIAAGFALLVHVLMRGALLDADRHRLEAQNAARQLAQRVEELQCSQEERAHLHEQLLHAQRMEAVGTLAAGIAHDMNNVLASISGLGSLVLGELGDPRQREDVERMLAQTERGAALTRSLLAFSRRGQYRKRPIRLWHVIRDVLPMLERTLPKSIAIRAELPEDELCVEADPTHLEQVLINLALNARDAMAGTGTLTISGEATAEHARLRVSDSGAGMDESTRRRAFEPFFTTKALGKGTGLGLSTVWGIVQAHGGTVRVDSQPGAGAMFTIELPISLARPIMMSRPSTAEERAVEMRGTVLVVDDEEPVRATSKRLLERMGLGVITAENGIEALRKFEEVGGDIALVVLDMGMPGMGGAECVKHLRESSDVPILIATGYAADEDAQAMVAQGAAILEKPFSANQLRQEVRRLLARTQARSRDADADEQTLDDRGRADLVDEVVDLRDPGERGEPPQQISGLRGAADAE